MWIKFIVKKNMIVSDYRLVNEICKFINWVYG